MGVEADPKFMAISSNDGAPTTWRNPAQLLEIDDPDLGQLRVRVWHNYHFRLSPSHSMSVVLVERLTTDGCVRTNKPMCLAFVGLKMPPAERAQAALFKKICHRPLVPRQPKIAFTGLFLG